MKALLPTLKENPRYILFKLISRKDIKSEDVKREIMFECKKYLGELGISKANLKFIRYNSNEKSGIIKTNSKMLEETKMSLLLIQKLSKIKAKIEIIKVSGMIKKLA
tara:strand:+ start:690 stop:1010 length:321 start_codon:yes stop_codon:yes gene_type:complete